METGTRVRIRDNEMTQVWGHALEIGTVTGPDPQGANKNVVCVRLDKGATIFDVKGINVGHLEVLPKKNPGDYLGCWFDPGLPGE